MIWGANSSVEEEHGNNMKIIKDSYKTEKVQCFCIVIALAALPMLSVFFMCLTENTVIKELYMPNAANFDWNDELFYYKQIEGIKEYGVPQGYFGYDESHAVYGTMGAWTPALYLFFVLYSKIFGWNFISPVWCNILILTVAMGVFAIRVRPDWKQTAAICGLYFAFMPINRFSLLCMPEISVIFLVILFCACYLPTKMKGRQSDENSEIYSWKELIALYIIVSLLILMRPYYILLLAPVGYQVYRKTQSKILIGLNIVYALACMALFLFINAYFCAPYFQPTIDLSWLQDLRHNFGAGLFQVAYILLSSCRDFFTVCGLGITDNSMAGGVFAVYVSVICMLSYELFHRRRQSCAEADRIMKTTGGWVICLLLMLCIKFLCYTVGTGYRHLLGFIILGSLILAVSLPVKKVSVLILIMFWCFFVKGEGVCEQLPIRTDERESEITAGSLILEDKVYIDKNADPWENTVIWVLVDNNSLIQWQDLYAFPSGIGINLCSKEYVLDNFEKLHSKYIMTNIGGEIDVRCMEEGKELLAEYGASRVYRLH